ncbi:MAG: helix-turn-helix transcriptional regulator [Acidimicrobiales bacterium]
MAAVRELTTTSYAILGLLALRPWTTYELAQQMTRALGQFWPRAESNLYAEPKKLVALGLAEASPEPVGKRPRTRYSITPGGRRALAAWMATPPASAGPVLEFEALVKVFFAEDGSKDDLVAAIDGVRDWVEERIAHGAHIPRQYLQGEGPFPERLPWLILAGTFLTEHALAIGRWAEWAAGVVEPWPDEVRTAPPDWEALERMADRCDEYLRDVAARRRAGSPTGPEASGGSR